MSKKQPWPTKDAMQQVYDLHLWGGKEYDFYSGEGSHKEGIVQPYVKVVAEFLQSFVIPITVCDLGCGDFNIGKQLLPFAKEYTAVDIVPTLIARNQELFTIENLGFQCLDIATAILPKADCVIIRQVLQHLSNAEVNAVVEKLYQYKYIILTEHLPTGEFKPNKDIISGQGIRIKKKSGVNLLVEPFNLQVTEAKELLTIPLEHNRGRIVTTLYRL